MNSVLLWIGGLLVAALALLFAVPHAIDWNDYRGVFEEEASRVLGREVRVGGEVNLRLLPMPYVRFDKVRIADADGSLAEPFFRAESFTLWLAVPPLLKGVIEANQVELDRPVLRLAFNERGQNNWQSFRLSSGVLPFVPSDVAFKSVRIREGTLAIKAGGALEASSLTDVNGEFSAGGLEGPFRFRGDVLWNGQAREVRVSTSAFEPDGTLRFKLTVHVGGNGNSYTLDGSLADLARSARISGDLNAQIRIDQGGGAAGTGFLTDTPVTPVFELRSKLAADVRGARLSELSLSYERDGKPQLITGSVEASWRTRLEIGARLSSRWLDLDRIASRSTDVSPLETARILAQGIGGLVPAEGATRGMLEVEQVNLGGDTVSGVKLALEREAGVLKVQEFKAALPGNARLDLQGTIDGNDARGFSGDLLLRGVSLSRFLAWAAPGLAGEAPGGEAPFWLASRLSLSPSHVEVSGGRAELGGAQLAGDVRYRWDGARELAVALEGASIDLSAVAPGLLTAGQLASLVSPAEKAQSRPGSVALRIRADEVIDGPVKLSDVDADISIAGGAVRMPVLKFTSADGLRVDMQGDVKDTGGRPSGQVRGFVSAPTAEAVAALGGLVGTANPLPKSLLPAGVSAFDLAFTGTFGERNGPKLTVRADGMLERTRASATVMLDGGLDGWREAPIDATVRLDGPDVIALVGGASGDRSAARSASLVIKVNGPSAASLITFAELGTGEDRLTFRGSTGLDAAGAIDAAGEVGVAVRDLGQVQELIGPRRRLGMAGIGISGTLDLSAKGKTVRLEPRGLAIGKAQVSGLVTLLSGGANLRVDGRLKASEASVASLIGLLIDGRAEMAEAAADALQSPWPDVPFAFGNLDGIEGQLVLSAGSLRVADRIALSDAELAAELSPGRVKVSKLEGRALGGRFASTMSLEKAAAGASLSFSGRLEGLRLEELAARRGSEPSAKGTATVSLDLQGRALSPRSLVSQLSGKGTAEITDARVSGIAAGAVDKAADAVVAGATEGGRSTLERELRLALEEGALAVGTRKVALEVGDGAVRAAVLVIDAPDGRVRNETTVDLSELKVDSEWQIISKRAVARGQQAPGKSQLPGVSVVYVGPLAAVGTLKPQITLDSLERELMVRRMEREVEQLERLRREDQERIKALETPPLPEAGPPVLQAPFPLPPGAAPGTNPPSTVGGPVRRRQSVVPDVPPYPDSGSFLQKQ